MKRYLEWRGRLVTLVENITDINDKIYDAARPLGIASGALAADMAAAYVADTDRLGLGRPDREPLASETVAEIVALIEELIATGHAYEAGGDVYFAVRSYDGLRRALAPAHRPAAGGRAAPSRASTSATRSTSRSGRRTSRTRTPGGSRRGGRDARAGTSSARRWRSASWGGEFDVHGGGRDLIFPHHENEIAQSRAGGRPFARTWAHNGMLRLSGEKMSKSLGNIEPLHEALDRWGAETLIAVFLRARYASPVDYTDEALAQAQAAARRCETGCARARRP